MFEKPIHQILDQSDQLDISFFYESQFSAFFATFNFFSSLTFPLWPVSATWLLPSSSRDCVSPRTKFSRSCIDCNLRWQKHFTQQPPATKTVACKYRPDFLNPFFCLQFKSNFTRLVKDGVFNPYFTILPAQVRSNEDAIRYFLISSFWELKIRRYNGPYFRFLSSDIVYSHGTFH